MSEEKKDQDTNQKYNSETDEAKPVGRPSKYKDEYCERLVDHMSNGLSYEAFAAVVKVNVDTLYEWEKVHPAFSEAKREAFAENLLFWERLGIEGLWGSKDSSFNSTVWIFNMKNRHKWRDKQKDEVDTVVNNNNTNNNYQNLSEDELQKKIDEKNKALEKK